MQRLYFGDITVDRLVESEGRSFYAGYLFPDSDDQAVLEEKKWLCPNFFDLHSGRLIMSVHTYIVRTPRHVILIDTCVGNDKDRPSTPRWHQQKSFWFRDLEATGLSPTEVDFVLCTHLHVDHVGWNTKLFDGRWVPTFPNAKYIFHKIEYDHWAEFGGDLGTPGQGANDDCFADSVLPIVEAGQALLVDGDYQIENNLYLEPAPGHTLGHVCLRLQSGSGNAVFCGDLMHHPIQSAYPDWNSRFCADPLRARLTRHRFIDQHAETNTIVLPAHFAFPTAGRIVKMGSCFRFQGVHDRA